MRISYNKLWKMLIDKNMKKSDLKEKAGIITISQRENKWMQFIRGWQKELRV